MWDVLNLLIQYLKNQSDRIVYVFIFSVVFFIIICVLQRKRECVFSQAFFGISCSLVFVLTLFGREQRNYGMVRMPFCSYIEAFVEEDPEKILQIIMNIVMYVPFGVSLLTNFKKIRKKWVVFIITSVISLIIELVQHIFSIGLFEIDDIINNVLGAIIGALLYEIMSKMRKGITSKRLKDVRNE